MNPSSGGYEVAKFEGSTAGDINAPASGFVFGYGFMMILGTTGPGLGMSCMCFGMGSEGRSASVS